MGQIWRRATPVAEVMAEDSQRVALLNLSREQPVILQGSAVAIWELIDGTRTEQEMLSELQAVYGAGDHPGMESQLKAFLQELSDLGLATAGNEKQQHP